MNIIELYDNLNGSYKSYLESFVAIKDERIKEKVSDSIKNEKLCKRVRDAALLSIFQFFTFAARI